MNEPKIEKDIPMPGRGRYTRSPQIRWEPLVKKLEIGDSFLVGGYSEAEEVYNAGRILNIKIRRRMEDKISRKIRVWRVA